MVFRKLSKVVWNPPELPHSGLKQTSGSEPAETLLPHRGSPRRFA